MTYDEIMAEITAKLTGDSKKDFIYLQEQCEKYKDSEYGVEIVRACGRLISELLTEEDKEDIKKMLNNKDIGIKSTLEEVKFNQYKKDFDKALKLMEPLVKKVEDCYKNGMFKEDKVSKFYCFEQPMETILYTYHNKPKKEIRHSDIPFAMIYLQYGSLLIDKNRIKDAKKVLLKAVEWNPSCASIIFELCETYKRLGELKKYFATVIDTFKYCYTPNDVARCYRNLGWYFIEKRQFKEAICAYTLSLQYVNNEIVQSELYYISQVTRKKIEQPTLEQIKKVAKKYGFPVGADEDVIGLSFTLGKQAMESSDFEAVKYYWGILYNLTEDEEIKKVLEKLK